MKKKGKNTKRNKEKKKKNEKQKKKNKKEEEEKEQYKNHECMEKRDYMWDLPSASPYLFLTSLRDSCA